MRKDKGNKHKISGVSVLIGVLVACVVFLVLENVGLQQRLADQNSGESDSKESAEAESTITKYETDIKTFDIKTSDGQTMTFNAPKDWYSLTDQYVENIRSFYEKEDLKVENMYVVGDSDTETTVSALINAAPVSTVKDIMVQLYGEEYDEEEMLVSEAYTYMTTGKLPEDLPDNYTLDEIDSVKVGDVTYKMYDINYDNTYVDGEESTEALEENGTEEQGTTTIHTEKIACYSDTEDPIEIILYMSEFDKDKGVAYLKEFLGAE